jgi:hypothetical protein
MYDDFKRGEGERWFQEERKAYTCMSLQEGKKAFNGKLTSRRGHVLYRGREKNVARVFFAYDT